jgi:hypothetical protein
MGLAALVISNWNQIVELLKQIGTLQVVMIGPPFSGRDDGEKG